MSVAIELLDLNLLARYYDDTASNLKMTRNNKETIELREQPLRRTFSA
jgi:hypothetical protein